MSDDRNVFRFAGLTVGTASGWDGDQEILMFYDVDISDEMYKAFPGLEDECPRGVRVGSVNFVVEGGLMEIYADSADTPCYQQSFTIIGK